jgi:hypothetical protein
MRKRDYKLFLYDFYMHIQSFKVFSNLAETSSFSKAAQMNGLTQSAVSQQVRALERERQEVGGQAPRAASVTLSVRSRLPTE